MYKTIIMPVDVFEMELFIEFIFEFNSFFCACNETTSSVVVFSIICLLIGTTCNIVVGSIDLLT